MPNQNRPLLVGITGGIGSGKSTICKVFNCLGVPVYDADSRARYLINKDTDLIEKIKNEFGEDSYEGGVLNRVYLANVVFSNPDKLEKLNAITHPAVAIDFENWVENHKHFAYLIKEAALLIESGAYKKLDKLILVTAPIEIRVQRVLLRDLHRSKAEIENIINQQMSDDEKTNFCDFLLNNGNSSRIIEKVLELNESFKKGLF